MYYFPKTFFCLISVTLFLHPDLFTSWFICKASIWPPLQLEGPGFSTHSTIHLMRKFRELEALHLIVNDYHWLLDSKNIIFLLSYMGKIKHFLEKNHLLEINYSISKGRNIGQASEFAIQFNSLSFVILETQSS